MALNISFCVSNIEQGSQDNTEILKDVLNRMTRASGAIGSQMMSTTSMTPQESTARGLNRV